MNMRRIITCNIYSYASMLLYFLYFLILKVQVLTSFVFLASGASPFPAACPFPFESSPGRLVAIIVNLEKFVTSKHESTQYTDTFL